MPSQPEQSAIKIEIPLPGGSSPTNFGPWWKKILLKLLPWMKQSPPDRIGRSDVHDLESFSRWIGEVMSKHVDDLFKTRRKMLRDEINGLRKTPHRMRFDPLSRGDFIATVLNSLTDVLEPQDEYHAISTLEFWSTLGPTGSEEYLSSTSRKAGEAKPPIIRRAVLVDECGMFLHRANHPEVHANTKFFQSLKNHEDIVRGENNAYGFCYILCPALHYAKLRNEYHVGFFTFTFGRQQYHVEVKPAYVHKDNRDDAFFAKLDGFSVQCLEVPSRAHGQARDAANISFLRPVPPASFHVGDTKLQLLAFTNYVDLQTHMLANQGTATSASQLQLAAKHLQEVVAVAVQLLNQIRPT
jgi:hypothetical protein